MNVFDLPVNFPSYQHLKVGDVFVWFIGDHNKRTDKGNPSVHAHWYTVTSKAVKYAEVDCQLMQCDNFGYTDCEGKGATHTYGWSKLEYLAHKTRWLRSPAAIVLFGSRVYGQKKPK